MGALAGTHKALFWEYEDFQDRTVRLWEWLAEVRRRSAVATISADALRSVSPSCPAHRLRFSSTTKITPGSQHTRLVAFYDRIEKAIRAVDPRHILFLE
jgi:hypothetical protein